MLLDAIILASGGAKKRGTKSVNKKQKYLFTADGLHSLLFLTIMRAISISPHRIVIITDKDQIKFVNSELEKVKRTEEYLDLINKNDLIFVVIKESDHKGSLASAALGAYVLDHQKNMNVAVSFPSEQIISNEIPFRQAIKSAYTISKKGYVIILGIATSSLSTNCGYIETENLKGKKWYTIKSFINDPDLESAENYIKDENYYYNSGIHIFKPFDLISEIKMHVPDLAVRMEEIVGLKASSPHFDKALHDIYAGLENFSMEESILLGSKNAVVIPAGFNWSDCREWPSAFEGRGSGSSKDSEPKKVISFKSKRASVDIDKKLMDVAGNDGFVAVDTHDAVLICDKNNSEDVKALNGLLEGSKLKRPNCK